MSSEKLEKTSKNVKAQRANISKETAVQRVTNYLRSLGLRPKHTFASDADGFPRARGASVPYGGNFPAEHEGAHALMTPDGKTIRQYQNFLTENAKYDEDSKARVKGKSPMKKPPKEDPRQLSLALSELSKAQWEVRTVPMEQLHGRRVLVYRNLHNGLFSVKEKGKVIAHVPAIKLADAEFHVGESGRQRVLRDKAKNVHAYVIGRVVHDEEGPHTSGTPITYNPYMHAPHEKGSFVRVGDRSRITSAPMASLHVIERIPGKKSAVIFAHEEQLGKSEPLQKAKSRAREVADVVDDPASPAGHWVRVYHGTTDAVAPGILAGHGKKLSVATTPEQAFIRAQSEVRKTGGKPAVVEILAHPGHLFAHQEGYGRTTNPQDWVGSVIAKGLAMHKHPVPPERAKLYTGPIDRSKFGQPFVPPGRPLGKSEPLLKALSAVDRLKRKAQTCRCDGYSFPHRHKSGSCRHNK